MRLFLFKILQNCSFSEDISDNVKHKIMINKINNLNEIISELTEESTKIGIVKVKYQDKSKIYYEIIIQKTNNQGNSSNQSLLNKFNMIIFKDITSQYKYNKSINKIKNRELTMAKLIHELKNPISTIGLIIDEIKIIKKEKKFASKVSVLSANEEEEEDDQSGNIIYNLSNYLMILIEDVNAFVKLNNEEYNHASSVKLPTKKINLIEILNFCYLIFYSKQKFDPNKQKIKINIAYNEEISYLVLL